MNQSQILDAFTYTLSQLQRTAQISLGQDDGEFFSAVTCAEVAQATNVLRYRRAKTSQTGIAFKMPVQVIELLETIHICNDNRQRRLLAWAVFNLARDSEIERAFVRNERNCLCLSQPVS
ncbi:hypothetical protein QE408_001424 [Agrobacterium larrymoorei]|uniref:Uncharacterized protein n=1 Tax=Agrobacterium larrymoorei TaxID=160699 RepID=A0ABU0UH79_9HYPH|nr:hypothetical protein [Agrobacterium larrymoorei]MDQ1184302.1 hypothetical protein [Agrobacterium larrymoorei]